jgi:hypothetical protein
MGFPYSTKFPKNVLMDDRIINLQSGRLHDSIRWSYREGKSDRTFTLWADDPKAVQLISGNKKMRPRNFLELAYERAQKKLRNVEKEFYEEVADVNKD